MSDAYLTALFLTLSGGFQDAYTYCTRGQVFANAQTGNVVLLSTHLLRGSWTSVLHYAIPLVAFVAGTGFAALIRSTCRHTRRLHWRQTVLLIEIALLFVVGFMPMDDIANAMVSFVCAMQVHAFRKVRGNAYASTMCIGNLRSGTELLCAFFGTRDRGLLLDALRYGGILLSFAVGAGLGSFASLAWGTPAIWCSCVFLAVGCGLMFVRPDAEDAA